MSSLSFCGRGEAVKTAFRHFGGRVRSLTRIGFTLIELTVAVSIIGTLLYLLVPSVNRIRRRAEQVGEMNNLRQLMVAVRTHELSTGRFPGGFNGRCHSDSGWVFSIMSATHDPTLNKF